MAVPTVIPHLGISAITLRLRPGDDLKRSLDHFVQLNNITAGCIITCVGSLLQAAIRFADLSAPTIKEGKFEIVSLTGTIAVSGSHLHIVVSDGIGTTVGGHLKEGSLVYTTAEIVLAVFPGFVYDREVDPTYGFKELSVRQAGENE